MADQHHRAPFPVLAKWAGSETWFSGGAAVSVACKRFHASALRPAPPVAALLLLMSDGSLVTVRSKARKET